MWINRKCPRCGSQQVQLSNERSKHGCLWLILFGIYYICWIFLKWMIGFCVFLCYDWWMVIVKQASGKGHVWQCKKFFLTRKKYIIVIIADTIFVHDFWRCMVIQAV